MAGITMREAQDAALLAWQNAQAMMQDLVKQWNMASQLTATARIDDEVLNTWEQVPPDLKAKVEQMDPEGYRRAMEQMDQIKKKRNR